jgi:predicted ATP-grasp superfamily ATP-dependent carboligase
MDIFHPPDGSLFGMHVEACQGRLSAEPPAFADAAAAAIVYAAQPVARMPAMDWPEWTADRQRPGSAVAGGAPLCTVLATADDADEARRLVLGRAAGMRAVIEAAA